MSYDPVTYWSNRQQPNNYTHIKKWECELLEPLIEKAQTVFDFGPGDGRMFSLYKGKDVTAYDIVDTYREKIPEKGLNSFTFTKDKPLEAKFDLAVCSKVVLHEPNPKDIIDYLASVADIVYLSTGIGSDSEHCFNHDYKELLKGYRSSKWQQGKDVVYIYG